MSDTSGKADWTYIGVTRKSCGFFTQEVTKQVGTSKCWCPEIPTEE